MKVWGAVAAVLAAGCGSTTTSNPTWAGCGPGVAPDVVVHDFPRAANEALPAGDSVLRCGNGKYGARHIGIRHAHDWGGVDWQQAAQTAITAVLAGPTSAHCDPVRNTCAYERNGDLVVLARENGMLITAYPRR